MQDSAIRLAAGLANGLSHISLDAVSDVLTVEITLLSHAQIWASTVQHFKASPAVTVSCQAVSLQSITS